MRACVRVCVCVCVCVIYLATVQYLGTYRTWDKICFEDCIRLGGENVGRDMESTFHVLYLTCFFGSWSA